MVVRDVLDNGLRLLTESIPHVRSVSLGVWLTRGSRHEGDEWPGIAHFVEHMLFKGTTTRSAEEIAQTVDSVGGQMDASTGKENANYAIKVLDDHLALAVDVLSDVVLHPRFAPDDIAREKGVVGEEIKMVEDMPDDLVHELFLERFWNGHPLGRAILGTADSVNRLNEDVLHDYFSRVYTAGNLIVAAAGHIEHARLRELIERAFGGVQADGAGAVEVPPVESGLVYVRTKDLEQSHICMGVGAYRQNHRERYAALVFNTLLGGSMSSRLFQNVREKRGLAYSVGSGLSAFRDAGLLSIYAGLLEPAGRRGRAGGHGRAARRGGGAHRSVGAGAGEGQREGQPDPGPREHVAAGGVPGPAGALLRRALHARRDAGGHRRRPARGRGPRGPGSAHADPRVGGRRGRRERRRLRRTRSAGGVMIARYTHPEMGGIWSDEHRYATWLKVEVAAAEAMADQGIIPVEAARAIRERGAFDVARIEAIEDITRHDIIAFTTAVAEHVGPEARWLHFGLTSSDVLDTALALQMQDACDLVLKRLDELRAAVRARALEHRRTPMIGRTHGVHAEPTTLGWKLALWYEEIGRDIARVQRARAGISVGKISGAVGTYAHLDPSIERAVCATLGLEPAPVSSQVIQRDRHAELVAALAITAASLEKFALEIRGLQKTEIGEVEEPFAKGQKGSSAMPHKRNPIGCEQIVGLARVLRGNLGAALENVALWHERDISHSSVERIILPDSFIGLDHMLRRFTRIVAGMVVYPERMRRNLALLHGVIFSGAVLLELARRGVSREQAYEWVQRNAMRSSLEGLDFRGLLGADADLAAVLPAADLDRLFDLDHQLRHVDDVFRRVFGEGAA